MKKEKKRRYKRRILIYSVLVFIIIFSIADYYFETYGLPKFAELEIKEKLKQKGFNFEFEVMKCGVINGIVLSKPVLKGIQYGKTPFFVAKKMAISFRPSFSGKYFISLDEFEVEKGTLAIPFFPEFGLEGEADIVKIEDFDAIIGLNDEGLEVKYFSGKLNPFRFNAAGILKNIFSPLASDSDNDEAFSAFSPIPAIKTIPYPTRARIYQKYLQIKEEWVFKTTPQLRFVFNIDTIRPEKSTMKADMKFPSFNYSGFIVRQVDTRLSYSGQKLILDSMGIKLFDIGELNLEGVFDSDTGLITGNINGTLSPSEVEETLKLLDLKLPPALQFTKKVSFDMELRDFSVDALQSQGVLHLKIPEATFKGVKIFNIQTNLIFSENTISGSELSFSTDQNKVNGNFQYNIPSDSIDASIQFSGPPLFIAEIIGDYGETMMNQILKRFTFPKKNRNIEISADIHFSWKKDFFYFISGNMVMHSFKYFDTSFKSGDARIIMDSNEILIIPMMTLMQKNSLATLAMVYDDSVKMKYHVDSPKYKSEYESNNRFLSDIQSSIPGNDVLKCIFPEWESEGLDMGEKINMKARGIIDFSEVHPDNNLTDFKVNVFDSSCKWYSLPVDNLNCDILFRKMNMEIKNVNAEVYNGDLDLYYKTDFNTYDSKIKINLKDADFKPVAKHVDWDLKGEGKLSVIIDADCEYDSKDNLLMTGKGNVHVRDANLWEVPILNTFGNLTSQWIGDSWGVISKLDADFKFRQDHLSSDNIQTDGNVVALRSEGAYYWTNDDFDFVIHAEILKSILPFKILTKVFDPITSLLETRVTRKNGKMKWQKVTLQEKIFRNNE